MTVVGGARGKQEDYAVSYAITKPGCKTMLVIEVEGGEFCWVDPRVAELDELIAAAEQIKALHAEEAANV